MPPVQGWCIPIIPKTDVGFRAKTQSRQVEVVGLRCGSQKVSRLKVSQLVIPLRLGGLARVPRCFRWNRTPASGPGGRNALGESSRPVPQGRPRIAQRFIAGNQGGLAGVPQGRKKSHPPTGRRGLTVLSSLRDSLAASLHHPALKRWAMVGRPCGTGREDSPKASLPPGPNGGVLFHRKQRGTIPTGLCH